MTGKLTEGRVVANQSKFVAKVGPGVVDVTTYHDQEANKHRFNLSTNEIPSGWNTFRLNNATHSDHFFLMYKVPQEAIGAAEEAGQDLLTHWYQTVTVPFQEEFKPYIAGNISYGDFANNLIAKISAMAPWFLNPGAVAIGGPGITAAGHTSQTTVNLSPGVYIAECYVKDENQEFHSYNGMLDMVTVKEESSGRKEPMTTMNITVSQSGIENPSSVRPGIHNIAIHFKEQPALGYEHLLGHNVQLVRLEEGYDKSILNVLGDWMDWTKKDGLVERSPEGTTFLGGVMEMPGGNTAYFSVNIKPGNYAWIAEVPNPSGKNMLKTFKVPFSRETGRR